MSVACFDLFAASSVHIFAMSTSYVRRRRRQLPASFPSDHDLLFKAKISGITMQTNAPEMTVLYPALLFFSGFECLL